MGDIAAMFCETTLDEAALEFSNDATKSWIRAEVERLDQVLEGGRFRSCAIPQPGLSSGCKRLLHHLAYSKTRELRELFDERAHQDVELGIEVAHG